MINLSRQSALLIALGSLVAARFVLLPILFWQSEQIQLLESHSRQLDKTREIADRYDEYQNQLQDLEVSVAAIGSYFYADDDGTKLRIQREVESYFDKHSLDIRGFNWTLDTNEFPRRLRAVVKFKGNSSDVIRTYWDLATSTHIIREVQSIQRFKQPAAGSLGTVDGDITLEFYAANQRDIVPDVTIKSANEESLGET